MTYHFLPVHSLLAALAKDVGLAGRDRAYILRRLSHEGWSFVTRTLPKFVKAVLKGLEYGRFLPYNDPDITGRITDFARKGYLPLFCRVQLLGLFDSQGWILLDPDPTALWQIRQMCEYLYKLALPFSEKQLEIAEKKFCNLEREIGSLQCNPAWINQLRKNFETYFPDLIVDFSKVLKSSRPRSSSGTYAGCRRNYYRHKVTRSFLFRYQPQYEPYKGFLKPYPSAPKNALFKGNDSDTTSELLFVPKDGRGPRVIIREPAHRLRWQMAFHDWLCGQLESITKRRINFENQAINQKIACQSSIDKKFATVDLESASDRVIFSVVSNIFRASHAFRFLFQNRSRRCRLPSGRIIALNKLAGMGSGLTFPTMSLLIYLAVCTECSNRGYGTFSEIMGSVYVYGDDLIIPRLWYTAACEALAKTGLAVNLSKSFSRGFFRESCGGDYFHGNDVAPVRLKLTAARFSRELSIPINNDHVIVQLERHARELVSNGLMNLSSVVYQGLEKVLGQLPKVSGESPVLGRWSRLPFELPVTDTGIYKNTLAWIPSPVIEKGPMSWEYFLGAKFKDLSQERSAFGLPIGCLAVPRKVQLHLRSISGYRLMG